MLIALLALNLAAPAHAEEGEELRRITLSCGGVDEDELSCVNEQLPEACQYSEETYKGARAEADANGDGTIQKKEREALLAALNNINASSRRGGCKTIKLVTDGRSANP